MLAGNPHIDIDPKDLLTKGEIADRIGVHRHTARKILTDLERDGRIGAIASRYHWPTVQAAMLDAFAGKATA